MTQTVFYSWQSDLPNSTNRGFIGDCIDRAIKSLHAELGRENALRAEDGVRGAPGNVDVARTIFERIDGCGIFVPDISIVTQAGAKRPMPNPNVMIEYGRATATVGDSRILPVFNTAYGNWETDRPFDMRHKNRPLTYHLPENPDQDQRDKARKALVKSLERAFGEIISAGLLESEQDKPPTSDFGTVFSRQDDNVFPVSLLGRIDPQHPLQEGDTKVWLCPGPQMFLRLIPAEQTGSFDPLDLRAWLPSGNVRDLMGHQTKGAFYYARNQEGAAAFTIDLSKTAENRKDAYAFGATQAFTNGELWGVDTWLLDPERTRGREENSRPTIAPHMLEEGLVVTLSQYLRFARDVLMLPLPLRCVAGLREIRDYSFDFGDGTFGTNFGHECIEDYLIDHYEIRIYRVLEPFFEKLWSDFGRRRPRAASDKWEQAVGFDLDAKP